MPRIEALYLDDHYSKSRRMVEYLAREGDSDQLRSVTKAHVAHWFTSELLDARRHSSRKTFVEIPLSGFPQHITTVFW